MLKKLIALLCVVVIVLPAAAQELKPMAKKIREARVTGASFSAHSLFALSEKAVASLAEAFTQTEKVSVLDFDQEAVRRLAANPSGFLELSIPLNGETLLLELYRADIFTPDFKVVTSTSNGQPVDYDGGLHYRGILAGESNSIAAISVYDTEVMGLVSGSRGNLVLGKMERDPDQRHIAYFDHFLRKKPDGVCYTPDDQGTYSTKDLQLPALPMMLNCIRLYWEVNYNIFQGKGSVSNATNYVTGLFNQSATIYANDNIPVALSEVFVWDVPSPYTSSTTGGLLGQFQSFRNSFNGDLGHLLGYGGGGGVAAGFSGLCASNLNSSQCYSGISSSYNNVPTYSWSVMVVTHEQGHLMGSRHTHACVWNGNNTAIDNCGPSAGYGYEGNCSGAPTPIGGGTIMSYCHLTGSGINFSNGFGSQPTAAILSKYNAASCLTACGTTGCGTPNGLGATNITQTTATVSWGSVAGANTYDLRHRENGAPSWTTVAGLSSTTYNLSSLIQGTEYQFEVMAVCTGNSSSWSVTASFTTATPPCNMPTGDAVNDITMNSAMVSWNAVTGAVGYKIQYYITGTQLFNEINNISGTSQELISLLPGTMYSVHIQTLCAGAYSSYTSPIMFTTGDCGPPPNHWITGETSTSAKCKWTKLDGALFYEVRYRVAGTTLWNIKKTGSNSGSKTITGLTPATTYEWKVRTRCSGDPKIWSKWTSKKLFSTLPLQPLRSGDPGTTTALLPSVAIHPNPAIDRLYVTVDPIDEPAKLIVADLAGRTLRSISVSPSGTTSRLEIDLSDFADGLYAVRIQGSRAYSSARFVVKH